MLPSFNSHKEETCASTIKAEMRYQGCNHCLTVIRNGTAFANNDKDAYRFCSEECLRSENSVHQLEMDCLEHLLKMKGLLYQEELAREKELEPLRLIVRVVAHRKLSGSDSSHSSSSSVEKVVPLLGPDNKFKHLMALEAVKTPDSEDYVQMISKRMEILLKIAGLSATQSEIEHLLFAIQCNAHTISGVDDGGESNADEPAFLRRTVQLGVGLFPMASMMNHSCAPNSSHYFECGNKRLPKIIIRATCDIEEGEEICYPYVPLFDSTASRRESLLNSYGFVCSCSRCLLHEDENMVSSGGGGGGGRCDAVINESETPEGRVSLREVAMAMQRVSMANSLRDVVTTAKALSKAVDAHITEETEPGGSTGTGAGVSPLNKTLFFAYNMLFSSSTNLLCSVGSPFSSNSSSSQDYDDDNNNNNRMIHSELQKGHLRYGLLALGAIKTFVHTPQYEVGVMMRTLQHTLSALVESGQLTMPLDHHSTTDATTADAVRRAYGWGLSPLVGQTVFSSADQSGLAVANSTVADMLEACVDGMDDLIPLEGYSCALAMLRDLFGAEADRITALCRG
jgi:hypothetical protein